MCLEARSQRGRDSGGEKRALFSVTAAFPVRRKGFLCCRGMFFFPAGRQEKVAADSDRARCGNRNEVLFFFDLKKSEAASDVGARAESIAGLCIAETALARSFSGGGTFKKGAARLPCVTWPRRHQTGGFEMQIVSFAPVMSASFHTRRAK